MSSYADVFYDSTDGLRLYARDYPADHAGAMTVLCMPGLTRNSRDFAALADHLSGTYRVLCAEQRGRGRSAYDPNWQNYHPGTYVNDMWTLLDHLGIERAALIGTSLGGLMAMIMAASQRQRVTGIVLNDVGPELSADGIKRIQAYVGKMEKVHSWDEAVAQVREHNAGVYPDFDDDDWRAFAALLYREDENGVLVADYDPNIARPLNQAEAAPVDLWPVFDMLNGLPVLALRGELSDILSPETFAEMKRRVPDMEMVTVPRCGHAPAPDHPVARGAIDAFLERLDSPAGG
ncbi:MAG: alpha/beta hydrolase [Alphaproteobacteria bacterium]|nr:MAG: alpha/beta hydrolase [Alphaproteobacteria bacterium]